MKFYLMSRQMIPDGPIVYQRSHELVELKTGALLGLDFEPPFRVELDSELHNGELPTFFTQPAIIGTTQLYEDLKAIGLDNIQAFPAIIRDEVDDRTIEGYWLLNIVGAISCVDMDQSDYNTLSEGMNIIDYLILDGSKLHRFHLFLVAEDTDCIVVSEKVYDYLTSRGYDDIYFEELKTV